MKKLAAAVLSAALIALSPGLPCYQALAIVLDVPAGQGHAAHGAQGGAPRIVALNVAPLGGDTAVRQASLGVGAWKARTSVMPGGLETLAGQAAEGPVRGAASLPQGLIGIPMEAAANSPAESPAPDPLRLNQAIGASSLIHSGALGPDAGTRRGRSNFEAVATGQVAEALSRSATNPMERIGLLDRLFGMTRRKGQVGAVAVSAVRGASGRRNGTILSKVTGRAVAPVLIPRGSLQGFIGRNETAPTRVRTPSSLKILPAVVVGTVLSVFVAGRAVAAGNVLAQEGPTKLGWLAQHAQEPLVWATLAVATLGVFAVIEGVRYYSKVRTQQKTLPAAAPGASSAQRLPRTFWTALMPALFLYQFGSWEGSPLIPKFGSMQGSIHGFPGLPVLGQLVMFAMMFPGSTYGKQTALKYNSALTFIFASLTIGGAIGSVALAASGMSSFYGFMAVFLLSRMVTGFVGSAVMGVAQTEIIQGIVGSDKNLLAQANALYGLPNKLMGVMSTALFSIMSMVDGGPLFYGWLAAFATAALFASVFPMARTRFLTGDAMVGASDGAKQPTTPREKLPAARLLAYIVAFFLEVAFFGIVGPIGAPLAFSAAFGLAPSIGSAMMGGLVAAFSLGGLLVTSLQSLSPKGQAWIQTNVPNFLGWVFHLNEMQWFASSMVAWPLLLGAMLVLHSPILSLIAALALGAVNIGAFNGLKTLIQERVSQAEIPQLMQKMSFITYGFLVLSNILLLLGPYVFLTGFTWFAMVCAAVALMGAGVYWKNRAA